MQTALCKTTFCTTQNTNNVQHKFFGMFMDVGTNKAFGIKQGKDQNVDESDLSGPNHLVQWWTKHEQWFVGKKLFWSKNFTSLVGQKER